MKVNIVESQESKATTDWNKVQIMQFGTMRVLSTGQHTEGHFCGIDLRKGSYSNTWLKSHYYPAPVGDKIIVEFQND